LGAGGDVEADAVVGAQKDGPHRFVGRRSGLVVAADETVGLPDSTHNSANKSVVVERDSWSVGVEGASEGVRGRLSMGEIVSA